MDIVKLTRMAFFHVVFKFKRLERRRRLVYIDGGPNRMVTGEDTMSAAPEVKSAGANVQASAISTIGLGFAADPNWIGQGLGALLMKHALRRCDEEGIAAYLESTNPRNISLYERHGFRIMGKIQSGTSPVMTPMLRPVS